MPRGGKRSGAGRPNGTGNIIQRTTALKQVEPEIRIIRESSAGQAVTAAMILAAVDENGLWNQLLMATSTIPTKEGPIEVPDWRTRLNALQYLTDRRDGKPRQAMELTGSGGGPIQLVHSVPRPARLDGNS
jgi:hypothetical protein